MLMLRATTSLQRITILVQEQNKILLSTWLGIKADTPAGQFYRLTGG